MLGVVFVILSLPLGIGLAKAALVWPDWRRFDTARPKISRLILIVMASTAIPIGVIFARSTGSPVLANAALEIAGASLMGWLLLFGALVDLRTLQIPDLTSIGCAAVAVAVAATQSRSAVEQSLIGWIIGATVLWCAQAAYRIRRGQDGLGDGDIKLFAAAGAMNGAPALPFILAGASAVTLVIQVVRVRALSVAPGPRPLPFAPALALAAYLAMLLER